MPLGIAALAVGAGVITAMGAQSEKKVLVRDESGIFENSDTDRDNMVFDFSSDNLTQLEESYQTEGYDLLVHIPEFNDLSVQRFQVDYYSVKKPGLVELERIESVIARAFREYKIDNSNIDRAVYESFYTRVKLESFAQETGEERATSGKMAAVIGTVLGMIMGILMYMVILIYGQIHTFCISATQYSTFLISTFNTL